MSAATPLVSAETSAQGVARIALNRPEKRNALNPELRGALIEAVGAALAESSVRALVLSGEGEHFCAGGDIESLAGLDAEAARARMQNNHRLVRLLAQAEKPVVAAVEGYAVGAGAGLALLADTIVLAEGGTIGFPFFRVGLTPDYGILHTLPRRVGPAQARQILLYARMLTGADAQAMGLADELVGDGETGAKAHELALELAAMPPHAFGLAKRHLAMAPQSLEATLEMEAMAQSLCLTGDEFAEGHSAFLEKRAPKFG